MKEILMPKMGVTMTEGKIIKWHRQEGDYVKAGEIIFELETDKVSMEVESTETGYIKKIVVKDGETVSITSVVAYIGEKDEEVPEAKGGAPEQAVKVQVQPTVSSEIKEDSSGTEVPNRCDVHVLATPRAKKLAKEKGIDIGKVTGTGENGRVSEDDVLIYIEQTGKNEVAPQVSAGRETKVQDTEIPFDGVRKIIAGRLAKSYIESPHVYFNVEISLQNCLETKNWLAQQKGIKISVSDFIIKACALALRDYPQVNSSLNADRIILHPHANIGFAVDSPRGLIVPVLAEADGKSMSEISRERTSLVSKALENKLQYDDIHGGTFTVSNLGTYGVDSFTAIINPPECAILAVGAIKKKLVVEDDNSVKVKPMMNMTLSVDHRVIDGALAAKFLKKVKEYVEKSGWEGEY